MSERYLTDAWFTAVVDAAAGLPAVAGLDLDVDVEITGGPDGKVRYHEVWRDGRLVAVGAGKAGVSDVQLTLDHADAVALVRGESFDVAFMQGRVKLDGAYEKWLYGFRAVLASPAYGSFRAAVAELTELA